MAIEVHYSSTTINVPSRCTWGRGAFAVLLEVFVCRFGRNRLPRAGRLEGARFYGAKVWVLLHPPRLPQHTHDLTGKVDDYFTTPGLLA